MRPLRLVTLAALVIAIGLVVPAGPASAAPVPTVTLVGLPTDAFLGSEVGFTVRFDNTSATGTDTGYGPYVDLVLPAVGIDGDDGITFVSATYLGVDVTSTTITFDGAGEATHPLTGAIATGTAGDELVVLQLPFGSFTVGQPAADVAVTVALSAEADLGVPLAIEATGSFLYGSSPTGEPGVDTLTGSTPSSTITPTLLTVTKAFLGAEDETATGPSFPRQYRLSVDVAEGQTITDLTVTDLLPPELAFLRVVSTSPGSASVDATPTVGAAANAPDNDLVVSFPSVTGGAGGSDAEVVFEFFVPHVDADATSVLSPTSGDDATIGNAASASYDWVPVDLDDPAVDDAAVGPASHTLTAKSIAIVKDLALTGDFGGGGLTPTDVVTSTLTFDVSDFFTMDTIVITDVLGDGLDFDTGSATITVGDRSVSVTGASIAPATTVQPCDSSPDEGTTELIFDVSAAIGGPGRLVGGEVGGIFDETSDFAAATGTVTYTSTVRADYRCSQGSGDLSVDQNDRLSNAVTVETRILDNGDLSTPTGSTEADGSGESLTVAAGSLTKSIYARNGDTGADLTSVTPGDSLTFRLRYSLPSSDIEALQLVDYLPLPVLDADELTGPLFASATPSATPPPAGAASFGPADSLRALSGADPTVSIDSDANAVTFDLGTYDGGNDTTSEIDLLFTLTVTDDPFADGLLLTNQARAVFQNSFAEAAVEDQIGQFTLNEPALTIRKGVIATDGAGTFSPTDPGPFSTITTPSDSANAPSWSGTVTRAALATEPVDSDLSGVDAGDLVTFAIVVVNEGGSERGAFDVTVTDSIPAGFELPSDGANVQARFGDGVSPGTTGDLFGAGLVLDDDPVTVPDDAALAGGDPGDGSDVLVVTYDLRAVAGFPAAETTTNTATLTNYAGTDGGPAFPSRDDTATVVGAVPAIDKTTSGATPSVGDQYDYQIVITVPEGVTGGAQLVDTLDRGLAFVSGAALDVTFDGVTTTLGNDATVEAGATIGDGTGGSDPAENVARTLTIPFGDLTRAVGVAPGTVTIDTTVVVVNASDETDRGDQLGNSAVLGFDNGSVSDTAPDVTIVEPELEVLKTVAPVSGTSIDAGDLVRYTITVRHTTASNADAHDVVLSDVVPAGLDYQDDLADDPGAGSTRAPTTIDDTGGNLGVTWTSFPDDGTTTVLTYTARIPANVSPGSTFDNSADLEWTSQVGSPAQIGSNTLAVERTGEVTDPGEANNDYAVAAMVTLSVDPATVDKQQSGTSIADPTTTGTDLTIGEIVSFAVPVQLPESSIATISVADTMASGTLVVPGSTTVVTAASDPLLSDDFAGSLATPTIDETAGDGNDLSVSFGASTVSADGDPDNNTFVVRYDVEVLDGALGAGDQWSNDVAVSLDGGAAVTDSITFDVVEPELVVDKDVGGQVGDTDSKDIGPGDTSTYTITVTNTGSSPAYDITIVDDYDQADVSVSTISDGGVDDGDRITWTLAGPLAAGDQVALTYDASLRAVSPPGDDGLVVVNTVDVTEYFGTLPGDRTTETRTYGSGATDVTPDSVTTIVRFPNPEVTKVAVDPGPAEIAEPFTFRITLGNPGPSSTWFDVELTDELPTNWSYVPDSATVGGSAVEPDDPTATTLQWTDAGDVTPGSTLVVEFAASPTLAAASTPGTGGGVDHVNQATADGDDGAGTSGYTAGPSTATTTLELPALTITKTPDGDPVSPGATGQYTINVNNSGPVPARDVVVTDVLGPNQTYTAAAASASPATGFSESAVVPDAPSAGSTTVTWTIDEIPAGGAVDITLPVTVATPLADGTVLDNLASVVSRELTSPVSDTGTLVAASAPDFATSWTKSATPADGSTVTPDDTITYTIAYQNDGDETATNVVIDDAPPPGTTVASVDVGTAASVTCDAGTGFAPCAGDLSDVTAVRWTVDTIAPPTGGTVSFAVQVDNPISNGTAITNTATLTSDQQPGGVTLGPVDHLVSSAPVLEVDKTVDRIEADLAESPTLVWTVTVTNTGTDAASAVTIDDSVPAEVVLTSIQLGDADAVSCDSGGGFGSCPVDPSTVTDLRWTLASLPAGDSVTASFSTDFDPTTTNGTVITNTATADSAETGPVIDDASSTVTSLPTLTVTKAVDPSGATSAGSRLDYTIEFANVGTAEALDVVVSDPVPAGSTYVAGSTRSPAGYTASWVVDGTPLTTEPADSGDVDEVRWTADAAVPAGTMAEGFAFSAVVDDPIDTGSTITNVVTVDATDTDPDTASTTTPVSSAPQLTLSKSAAPTEVRPGTEVTFTLLIEVSGTAAAAPLTVADQLPDDLTFLSASDGGLEADGVVSWDLGPVEPGDSRTVTVVARLEAGPPGGAELVNRATASAPGATDATDDDVVTVAADAALALAKVASRSRVVVGEELVYTLTLSNTGDGAATDVTMTDQLPEQLELVSASPVAVVDGATITWSFAQLAPGDTTTATVVARVIATGTIINRAVADADNADPPPEVRTEVSGDPGPGGGNGGDDGDGDLPGTGADVATVSLLGVALLATGAALMWSAKHLRLSLRSEPDAT